MLRFEYQKEDGWKIRTPLAHQGSDDISVFLLDPSDIQNYKARVPADCCFVLELQWLALERPRTLALG